MLWGRASSVTEAWPRCSVVRMARRVESLRAAKVASRLLEYLTIRLCIITGDGACQAVASFFLGKILNVLILQTKSRTRKISGIALSNEFAVLKLKNQLVTRHAIRLL